MTATLSPGGLVREAVLSVLADPHQGWNAKQARHAETLGLGAGYPLNFGSPRSVIRALVNPSSPTLTFLAENLTLAAAATSSRNTGRATMGRIFNGDVEVVLQFLFRYRLAATPEESLDVAVNRGEMVGDLIEATSTEVLNSKSLDWQKFGRLMYADRISSRRYPSVPYSDGYAVATTVSVQFEVTL